MVKARLQHITIAAYDQEKVADFYCKVFGMKVVWRRPPDTDGRPRGIFLTDGHINFGIHKAGMFRGTFRPEGFNHIGFLVDDMEEVEALAEEYGAMQLNGQKERAYSEDKYSERGLLDPVGGGVDLSERGYGVEEPADGTKVVHRPDPWALPGDTKPRIQHFIIAAHDQEKMAQFYCNVLGMQVVFRKAPEPGRDHGIFLTDGHVNFGIRKAGWDGRKGGGIYSPEGIHHMGFAVDDMEEIYRRAEEAEALHIYRKTADWADGAVVDPIGIRADVSERGFLVDVPENVYVNPLAAK